MRVFTYVLIYGYICLILRWEKIGWKLNFRLICGKKDWICSDAHSTTLHTRKWVLTVISLEQQIYWMVYYTFLQYELHDLYINWNFQGNYADIVYWILTNNLSFDSNHVLSKIVCLWWNTFRIILSTTVLLYALCTYVFLFCLHMYI